MRSLMNSFTRTYCLGFYSYWASVLLIAIAPISSRRCSGQINFTDVTESTGIDFIHFDGHDGRHFLIESMSAGLALFDFDNDSDLDIYFLSGAPIDSEDAKWPANHLYRNDGDLQFTNVGSLAGVADLGFGLGVACADFNNDGFVDVYVNNYGNNVLYRNNGDGTYDNVAETSNTTNGIRVGGGASFLDIDRDGNLDLYVANYIEFDEESHEVHYHKGLPSYPSPLRFEPAKDTLFRNLGDGTFADISLESGIHDVAGRSMGLATLDVEPDGDTDIFVANDSQENHLFLNEGNGRFIESALLSGLAFDFRGRQQASMGVAILDSNNGSLFDLVVTSFSEEFVTIYKNGGEGFFQDSTIASGIGPATLPHVTWGVIAEDFNLDGNSDLFVAAGDLDDNRSQRGGTIATTGFNALNLMFRGAESGRFQFLGNEWGTASSSKYSTRCAIAGDLDNDGDPDLVLLNARNKPSIFRNECDRSPLKVQLTGTLSNRDGIGALVSHQRNGDSLATKAISSGQSYQGDARNIFISFANAQTGDSIEVRWPSGAVSHAVITNVETQIKMVESREFRRN